MKRTILLIGLVVAAGFTSIAQEKVIRDANVEKREVPAFHSIRVGDGIDLYLTQSDEEGVAVSANKIEDRDKIRTEVENGVLRISYGRSGGVVIGWRNRSLKAYVSVKTLKELRAGGGSDVYAESGLTVGDFKLHVSGGSDFRGTINAENLELRASGGSDIRISGKAVNLKASCSGGSDIYAFDLEAEYAFVSAGGGSDARVHVTRELGAEASGGSDIDYKGDPVIKYKSTGGGSSVSRRN
jgi:hypothetical protein